MIYLPKIYGVCAGSKKAIDMCILLRKEYKNKKIYIYKELLHNEYVIKYLEKNSIECTNDLSKINKDDILIIRAHGESKKTFEYLKTKGIKWFDATCKNVIKVHETVESKYKEGYKIIIFGSENHPEVIGTNGWCNDEAIIIENKNDIKLLNKSIKYYLVSQTTASYNKFIELIKIMKNNNINFEYENTICMAQKIIQDSSIQTAKKVDVMFAIGGKNSSNSKELYECVSKVTPSYYFSNIKDFYEHIKSKKYNLNMNFGFTGGASTLKCEIDEYIHLLEFMMFYKDKVKDLTKLINKENKKFTLENNTIIDESINEFIRMNNDGKFLRGCLINLGYSLKHNDNYSDYLSVAYETFETSILIHDDIIDNASSRRGKETIHNYYYNKFKNYGIENNSIHNNLAICIGDLGIFYTNKIILDHYKNDKNLNKILSYYNNIVINTIKGEILDVYLPFIEMNDKSHILNEDDIMKIYELKTSWYSIVGPFCLGMILGGCSKKNIKYFEQILMPLGYYFQIKDDILGIFGLSKVTGKSVTSDIEEFKQTILYSYIKIKKPECLNELLKYYGHKINENDLTCVKELLKSSGALEYANNKMSELYDIVKSNIESLKIKNDIKNILLGLIVYLLLRDK